MSMTSFILLVGTTLLLLQAAVTLAFSHDPDFDTDDDLVGFERARRGWSMMRLGRGLQMLRLGKRTAPPPPSPDRPQSTPEQMREMLAALIDESRQESRRQPPLPRYGRELDQEAFDELYNLLGEAYLSKIFPYRFVHANRFKRSTKGPFKTSQDASSRFEQFQRSGSSAASSPIGQYLGHVYDFQPIKAESMSRTGLEKTETEVVKNNFAKDDVTSDETSRHDSHNLDVVESEVL